MSEAVYVNGRWMIRAFCPNHGTPFYRGTDGFWAREPHVVSSPFDGRLSAEAAARWENN